MQRAEPIRILAVPGGMRLKQSHNVRLLRAASRVAGDRATFSYFLQSSLASLPIFSPDLDPPREVQEFRSSLEDADALLIATPEYIGSLPGGVKNALDWAALGERRSVLDGKPAAVIGADDDEFGGDWAQADARKVLDLAGADVVADGVSVPGAEQAFDDQGELNDRESQRLLGEVVNRLIGAGRDSRSGRRSRRVRSPQPAS